MSHMRRHFLNTCFPVLILLLSIAPASGKTYRVLSSTTMNSDWQELASGLDPNGVDGSFDIDTTGGGSRFYRVEVSQ